MQIEEVNSLNNIQKAFFFIPDISGYTKFINHTDLQISKNIIKVLLETILDSNELNLKVSEIQGDAIVFYHIGTPPSIKEIELQAIKTFTEFHNALHNLVSKDDSQQLSELSLKIIIHYGDVSTTKIKDTTMLLGSDVILAIRILKNNIHENEYLLMTEKYLQTQPADALNESFTWANIMEGKSNYDYFAPICFKYLPLSPLKNQQL